jgi:hypothetical protein
VGWCDLKPGARTWVCNFACAGFDRRGRRIQPAVAARRSTGASATMPPRMAGLLARSRSLPACWTRWWHT